jgi:hypothetical protein
MWWEITLKGFDFLVCSWQDGEAWRIVYSPEHRYARSPSLPQAGKRGEFDFLLLLNILIISVALFYLKRLVYLLIFVRSQI